MDENWIAWWLYSIDDAYLGSQSKQNNWNTFCPPSIQCSKINYHGANRTWDTNILISDLFCNYWEAEYTEWSTKKDKPVWFFFFFKAGRNGIKHAIINQHWFLSFPIIYIL